MILHCKNCKKKFSTIEEDSYLEGRIVKCRFCNEEWIYESKSKYLEKLGIKVNDDGTFDVSGMTRKHQGRIDNIIKNRLY